MEKVDFFTGETALEVVSPPVSQAEANASIGQTIYGGGPPRNLFIGGVNYNQGPPYQGIGYNAGYNYGYYNQPNYTQYGYGYNAYGGAGQGNPAFGFAGNQPNVVAQDVTVDIPAVNPSGSIYLLPSDYEDRIFDLEWQYWWEMQQSTAEQQMAQPQFGYGYPNYYGMGYTQPFVYNNYNGNKYIEEAKEILEKAKQDRIEMNINLAKLAHNYLGEEYNEEDLRELYTGKTVTIPNMTTVDVYDMNRFHNLVPFDNSQMYRDRDAQISREFRKRIGAHDDMNTCFENLALVDYDYKMEEEMHRRNQDLKTSYDSNTFRTLIRQKVFDEKIKKQGLDPGQVQYMKDNLLGSGLFPTLSQHAKLADDGTLNITYSYGPNQVNNLNESQYQKERERFNSFLNSIPSSLNGGGG